MFSLHLYKNNPLEFCSNLKGRQKRKLNFCLINASNI